MERENIYENLEVMEAAPQPKGNPTETSVPWWRGPGRIVIAVLLLVTLMALASSLLAVTLLYFRAQSKLQAVEEAVQKLQVSLRPDNASDTSAKESDSLQLLDEALAGVRVLKDQLGHVSAAYGEIQTRLDNVSAAQAAGQGRCSYVLKKLSRGWRFYGGNFYYFSQEKKAVGRGRAVLCVSGLAPDLCLLPGGTGVSLQREQGRKSLDWTHRPGDRRQLALGGWHRIQSRRKQGVLGGESARQLASGDRRQRRLRGDPPKVE
nr:C-type lectin domain family 4 member K-like [Caretta caretta]